MPDQNAERQDLNKLIRKKARQDVRDWNSRVIEETIERNRGPKVFVPRIAWKTDHIQSLKNENGIIVSNKREIVQIV